MMTKQRWMYAALVIAFIGAGLWVWRQVHYERTKHLSRESLHILALSPDGSKVVIGMTVMGQPGTYMVDIATSELRAVHYGGARACAWSDSGRYFAVVTDDLDALMGPADPPELKRIGEGCREMSWAPGRDEVLLCESADYGPFVTIALVTADPVLRTSLPTQDVIHAAWAGESIVAQVVSTGPGPVESAVVEIERDGSIGRTIISGLPARPDIMSCAGHYVFAFPREPFSISGPEPATVVRCDARTGERSETVLAIRQMQSRLMWVPSPDGAKVAVDFFGLLEEEARRDPAAPGHLRLLVYEYKRPEGPATLVTVLDLDMRWRSEPTWVPNNCEAVLLDPGGGTTWATFDLGNSSITPMWPGIEREGDVQGVVPLDGSCLADIEGPSEAGLFVVDRATGSRRALVRTRPWDAKPAFLQRLKMAWKVLFP